MRRLRSRLPPVNSLVAFEAAVRHLSFTRAAVELGVTREAVSRQIRILERSLGRALFVRRHRALELTAAGESFGATVHASLEAIAAAAGAVAPGADPGKLTVTATVAIASFWLTPRLPAYRRQHPKVEIRVAVSDPDLDFDAHGIDVGLRYGSGNWPGLAAVRLFECQSFPMCSPDYLERAAPMHGAEDLAAHPLLNLDGARHASEDWAWWLGRSAEEARALDVVGFDNYATVVQAALDGQGVALGFSGIVDALLDDGRLVRPVPAVRSPGHAVYLVAPGGRERSEQAETFYRWVLLEAGVAGSDDARA